MLENNLLFCTTFIVVLWIFFVSVTGGENDA